MQWIDGLADVLPSTYALAEPLMLPILSRPRFGSSTAALAWPPGAVLRRIGPVILLIACPQPTDTDTIDDCAQQSWFLDADADGYGDPDEQASGCVAPTGYVEDANDCDDSDPDIHPGARDDLSTAADDDCAGETVTAQVWGEDAGVVLDLVGDVNADGAEDVAIACDAGVCLLSDNVGPVTLTAGTSAAPAWDLDGDGFDDVWTGHPASNEIVLWSGGPEGPVERARLAGPADEVLGTSIVAYGGGLLALDTTRAWRVTADPGPGARAIDEVAASRALVLPTVARSAGDFDGDGLDDVVARQRTYDPYTEFYDYYAGIWLAPGLVVEFAYKDATRGTVAPALDGVGDLDGDGYGEVVVGGVSGGLVLAGNVDGWLYQESPLATLSQRPADAAGADVDGDGERDLVIGLESDDYPVLVFLGPIEGGLSRGDADARWRAGDAATGRVVALGDGDGDGAEPVLASAADVIWLLARP